jgi:translation initiation factor IF-3
MPEPDKNELRINRNIRVPRVLLIDQAGVKLGEFMTSDALRLAEERGLDLIEVAPNARPPVCRIADFGRMKYERKKKESAARRNQVQVQLKEVKLRPKTDEHDMQVKVGHARRFLEEGNKVKVTVRFRGREMAHREIGAQQCMRVANAVKELGAIESAPRMDGRQMFMILAPTKKPPQKPARVRKQAAAKAAEAGAESSAPETDVDTAPETDVDTAPETDVETAPETDVETASETDVETAPETDVETASETDVETAPETDVETAPETDVETAPETDVAAAVGAESVSVEESS